jgi:hypothetical protein
MACFITAATIDVSSFSFKKTINDLKIAILVFTITGFTLSIAIYIVTSFNLLTFGSLVRMNWNIIVSFTKKSL